MKRLFILVSIILLFLILPYCKTADETTEVPFESKSVGIWSLTGRGTYDSTIDESTLRLHITLRSQIGSAENKITNWRIKLFVKGELFIEINQDNYKTLFGDNAYVEIDQPINQDTNSNTALGHVRVYADASYGKPIPGDFYNGKNPDSFEAIITIKAFTGYVYEISRESTNYTFSRN